MSKTCPQCQAKVPDKAKFCPECSNPVTELPEAQERVVIRVVDPILKPKEAAQLIKIDRTMLDELRKQGKLPKNCYFEIPPVFGSGQRKIYRYRAKELIEWTQSQPGPITTAG